MALKGNLISVWELSEASGNALDAHGSNDLTETGGTIASASGPGGLDGARDFEAADTEWFEIADNADFSGGDVELCLSAWVRLESKSATMAVVAKATTANTEYYLIYNSGTDRFFWLVSNNGTSFTYISADNLGSPSTGVWYHLVVWHSASSDEIGICANAGTPNATSHSTGIHNGAGSFRIGHNEEAGSGAWHWDGLIAQTAFWRGRILTSDERTALYNSGNGLPYADWDAGTAYDRSYSELLGLGNPYQRIAPSSRAYAVNAGSADTFARLSAANRTLLESLGNSDAYARIVESSRALAEILGVSEAVALERILGESGVITWRLRSNPQSPEGSVWELSPN